MADAATSPSERWGLKARHYPSWSPRTADSALRYPSSPAGVAAARKRLFVASSPPPRFELPESPSRNSPGRESPVQRRHALSAFAHPRYEERVPHEIIDAFAFYDANHSGFLDYLELRAALRGYGYDADLDECVELLRQYDDDLDGRLSLVRARARAHARLRALFYASVSLSAGCARAAIHAAAHLSLSPPHLSHLPHLV
jgi:hypothetical protein